MGKAPKFADFFKLEVQNPPKAQLGKEVRLAEHAQYEVRWHSFTAAAAAAAMSLVTCNGRNVQFRWKIVSR